MSFAGIGPPTKVQEVRVVIFPCYAEFASLLSEGCCQAKAKFSPFLGTIGPQTGEYPVQPVRPIPETISEIHF
jgi:hypothetical protein